MKNMKNMQNNDLTVWVYSLNTNKKQELELRRLGFVDGVYTCPCGTCDSIDVLFLEFLSEAEADAFSSALEKDALLSPLFA